MNDLICSAVNGWYPPWSAWYCHWLGPIRLAALVAILTSGMVCLVPHNNGRQPWMVYLFVGSVATLLMLWLIDG